MSHSHSSEVSAVRSCTNEKGFDLLAVGDETFVEILQRDPNQSVPTVRILSSFHIGSSITAIAWSPRTISPGYSSDEWFLELAVAAEDGLLRVLTQSATDDSRILAFGAGLSGHRGRVNDICFCTAGDFYSKFIASVGDDSFCIVWDLYPPAEADLSESRSPSSLPTSQSKSEFPVSEPVAYPIKFAHPLHTVASHTDNARSFMVSDSHGNVSVINWTELEPSEGRTEAWRGHRVAELVDPKALAESLTGVSGQWGGGAGWKPSDVNIFGATHGSRWVIWDLQRLQGGKPALSGEAPREGGHRFRWCPLNPHLFAISTLSPISGAIINVYHTSFAHTPRTCQVLPQPNRVRDFDWLYSRSRIAGDNIAWLAVAVGQKVLFVQGGELSE